MFFHHRIKRTNGEYTKGVEVHETLDSAEQAYHAYLGAYAYGRETGTDFVHCMITDEVATTLENKLWKPTPAPTPEPSAE